MGGGCQGGVCGRELLWVAASASEDEVCLATVNGWSASGTWQCIHVCRSPGVFDCEVSLPGVVEYQYKFVVDGSWKHQECQVRLWFGRRLILSAVDGLTLFLPAPAAYCQRPLWWTQQCHVCRDRTMTCVRVCVMLNFSNTLSLAIIWHFMHYNSCIHV